MFIILTYPRTGSSHLVRLLDSHPDCVCIGEAFKPNPYTIAHPNLSFMEFLFQRYGKFPRSIFFIKSLYKLIWKLNIKKICICPDYIGKHLVDLYVHWLKEVIQDYEYGIKIHIEHFNAFPSTKHLLLDSKIIVLKRTNILKSYISLLRANQTKIFATSKNITNTPIKIDTTVLIKDLTEIENKVESLDEFYQHSRNTYQILYEDMIDNWSLVKNELLEFLNLEINGVELGSSFKKIASGQLENDIQNLNEVKYALKNTHFEAFLH